VLPFFYGFTEIHKDSAEIRRSFFINLIVTLSEVKGYKTENNLAIPKLREQGRKVFFLSLCHFEEREITLEARQRLAILHA
jgi:hypothetical protein